MTDSVRVGVLSLHNSKETKSILNTVEKMGHTPVWLRRENINAEAGEDGLTVEPEVDVVVNRLMLSNNPRPSEELGLAFTLQSSCPMLNPPRAIAQAIHKFASAAQMAEEGIPIPTSALGIGGNRLEELKDAVVPPKPEQGSMERDAAVHKLPIGTHGDETTKIEGEEIVPQLTTSQQGILQQLIENPHTRHNDVRVYVVDGEVIGAMRRYAPEEDWRTNVARGGDVEDVTDALPDEVFDVAVAAADALDLDYAGIDLVEGKTDWYVLEANPTAGFKGFYRATGINPAPHIARLAIETGGGEVNSEEVERLTDELDDSVPSARPPLEPLPDPREDAVGQVERVQVSGQTGSEIVPAKADSGATRTSIDTELAGKIGAGPIKDVTSVKSGLSGSGSTRPLVDVRIRIGDYTHEVTVNIEDRSHMEHSVLLGRDILECYSVRVREENIAETTPRETTDEE